MNYIIKNCFILKQKIKAHLQIIQEEFNIESESLIIPIKIGNNTKVLKIQKKLKANGFLIGAIRQPTVKSAIIRLILRIDVSQEDLKYFCKLLKNLIET